MLIIGRKRDQKIIINDDIEITILEIGRNRVRFGVQAPKSVRIHTKLQHLPNEEPGGPGDPGDESTTREVSVPVRSQAPQAKNAPPQGKDAAPQAKKPVQNQSFAGAAAAIGRRSG